MKLWGKGHKWSVRGGTEAISMMVSLNQGRHGGVYDGRWRVCEQMQRDSAAVACIRNSEYMGTWTRCGCKVVKIARAARQRPCPVEAWSLGRHGKTDVSLGRLGGAVLEREEGSFSKQGRKMS
ncbi:unnamed protein product [Linum trigynum]|uniref:Uncharacterized protein n=1 Tax=Linum trigynum TaxID=586398 RepID=A0AAV2CKP3_9ROSI